MTLVIRGYRSILEFPILRSVPLVRQVPYNPLDR